MLKGYGAVILDGAWLTLQLALSSMALAIVLGLIGVSLRLSPVRWLAWLGDLYSTVIRGIPDLVLILLIFYGGQDLLNRVAPLLGFNDYIDLNPLAAGIGTLVSSSLHTCRKRSVAPSWRSPRGRRKPAW